MEEAEVCHDECGPWDDAGMAPAPEESVDFFHQEGGRDPRACPGV